MFNAVCSDPYVHQATKRCRRQIGFDGHSSTTSRDNKMNSQLCKLDTEQSPEFCVLSAMASCDSTNPDHITIPAMESTVKQEISNATAVSTPPSASHTPMMSETPRPQLDPYAYTRTEAFTSEIFKVEIQNFPRFFGIKQLKKKLAQIHVIPCKVKMIERSGFAFVNFSNEEERENALSTINGQVWKNRKIHAKKANPATDPMVMKRKLQQAKDGPAGKVPRTEDNRTVEERLKCAVTPLWEASYETQIKKKVENAQCFLKNLGRVMENENPKLKYWLALQRKETKGLCCTLLPFKKSPVLMNYRNKCEFTIGQSVDSVDKTVGFRLGAYKKGHVCVAWPGYCDNINKEMVKMSELVQEFCQTKSDLIGFHPEQKIGHWREVTVRTSLSGGIMVIVLLHKEGIPQEKVDNEKKTLREFFESEKVCSIFKNVSLYLELKGDDRKSDTELFHLLGDRYIYEKLSGLEFRISPSSFFQVNTLGAEILYSSVVEWANINKNTVVLDVCCGTGTIGLTLAKKVKKVIGIELCKEAVEDAKYNAKINGIKNAEFYCGKAEEVLPKLIGKYKSEDVVAIVDPPRAGLHVDVVVALRNSQFLKRLVYVSCSQKGAKNNIIELTRKPSRRLKSTEFCLLKSLPVDLFPMTHHYELIMLFERYADQELTYVPQSKEEEANTVVSDETNNRPTSSSGSGSEKHPMIKVENVPQGADCQQTFKVENIPSTVDDKCVKKESMDTDNKPN